MPQVQYDAAMQRYILSGVDMATVEELSGLRWRYQNGVWSTPSPYYAAPLWKYVHPEDKVTQQMLGAYAWNYAASFAKEPQAGTGIDRVLFPAHEDRKPMDFQVAGVQLAARQKATLIADPMGLGKTMQAIGVANIRQPRRTLIGCPAFLALNWADELVKWCTFNSPITIIDRPSKSIPDEGFVIMPYSRAFNFWGRLLEAGMWDLTILDEIHFLKGEPGTKRIRPYFGWHDAQTGNMYPGIVQRSHQIVGMTGTPIPNAPHEMYNVLSTFRPDIMGSITRNKFKEMYCTTKTVRGNEKVAGSINEAALNAELRASGLMVRRNKEQVLDQLPPKVMNVVQMRATNAIADLVQQEASYYDMLEMRMFEGQKIASLVGHIAEVRAKLGVEKAPQIAEYAWDIIANGEKRLVVFMWHTAAIRRVAELLERKGNQVRVHVLDGHTSVQQRFARVREFQDETDTMPQIIIGQIKAAGVGLTMTSACHMILGELAWSPADNDQAIDRVHRISQLRQVTAHILTYPHSADVRVIKSNARKAITASQVLDTNLLYEFEKLENVHELDVDTLNTMH